VVSLNLKRRHLDESQRAMVAKKLASLERGQRQTGKFAGVTTQAEAASMLNVSERSVRTAGAVIDKAVPEIVTAVENGDVSVSAAAQFAKQPKEEQAKQIAKSATPVDAVKAFHDSRQIGSSDAVGDDGHAFEPKRPDIGSVVVYVSRPGEGRAGKSEFPALVMHHEPDGESVVLLVIYDVDDMVTRPALREVSEDFPWPAWRHVKGNAPEKFEPTRINHIRRDLDEVRVGLNETREALYGEWEKPDKSFVDLMASFEKRLKVLEQNAAKVEALSKG
jgi:hypothetical protein